MAALLHLAADAVVALQPLLIAQCACELCIRIFQIVSGFLGLSPLVRIFCVVDFWYAHSPDFDRFIGDSVAKKQEGLSVLVAALASCSSARNQFILVHLLGKSFQRKMNNDQLPIKVGPIRPNVVHW